MSELKFDNESSWKPGIPDNKAYSGDPSMQPESFAVNLSPHKHEHYYIRISTTDFGCQHCTNRWIDGGKFIFENGRLKDPLQSH